LSQWWTPPLRLQVSASSTLLMMCDVPSMAVSCRESIECSPGIVSRYLFIFYLYYYYYYCCCCCYCVPKTGGKQLAGEAVSACFYVGYIVIRLVELKKTARTVYWYTRWPVCDWSRLPVSHCNNISAWFLIVLARLTCLVLQR
jgi:hypothetical protein